MKKIYNAPVVRVHNLQPVQMMALSTNDNNGSSLGSGDIGSNDGQFTINTKEEQPSFLWDE